MGNYHISTEKITNSEIALNMLKDGNNRFVENKLSSKDDYSTIRETFKLGQNPFAAVVCCSDSRVVPEIFFDQKLGDIFVIRNAGNVVDEDVLGSLEYAVEHLKVSLVVVIGHTNCGAVTAACKKGKCSKNVASLLNFISPSVDDNKTIDEIAELHSKSMAKIIEENEVIKSKNTKIIPACYDVVSGKVKWL